MRLKQEIFDYQLLPHDRFSETELAARYQVSRTPVRDALYRLEREGYLEVGFRRGWTVKPLDFDQIDELYDLRVGRWRSSIVSGWCRPGSVSTA